LRKAIRNSAIAKKIYQKSCLGGNQVGCSRQDQHTLHNYLSEFGDYHAQIKGPGKNCKRPKTVKKKYTS
jgi:hypothetical protein